LRGRVTYSITSELTPSRVAYRKVVQERETYLGRTAGAETPGGAGYDGGRMKWAEALLTALPERGAGESFGVPSNFALPVFRIARESTIPPACVRVAPKR